MPPLTLERAGDYEQHLESKVADVRELLAEHLGDVPLRVYPSPKVHYRYKIGYPVWRVGDVGRDAAVGYKNIDPDTKTMVEVHEQFSNAERINELMPLVLEPLNADPRDRRGLQKFTFVSSSDGEALVSLHYGHPLHDGWLQHVAEPLHGLCGASVVGRARGQRLVAGSGQLVQWFEVDGRRYPQIRDEEMFVQSNVPVCHDMIRWASEETRRHTPSDADLLELYCGNGNFTLPLSANFRRVFATERDGRAVPAALQAIELAALDNVRVLRLSAEETLRAMSGRQSFKCLEEAGLDLRDYNFGAILVDPPRPGLDEHSRELIRGIDHCVYISCNPNSLASDLKRLDSHVVVAAALFDQFPYTPHAEVGVLLSRRAA